MTEPLLQAVSVVVAADEADLASGLLWGAGVTAVSEVDGPDGTVVLTADLPPGGLGAVEAALGGRWPAVLLDVADDGLNGWRDHATVVRAGEHLVVQPPWVPYEPAADDVVLAIDPGRSFGHGAHPTTRLCLAAVERLVTPGCSVLDVGCGSGVLAIAAARLGADRVVAVDIDPEAVAATTANATTNVVRVDCSGTGVESVAGRFDLVLANIGSATLVTLAPSLTEHLAPGGTLVISGLLSGRSEEAVASFPWCERPVVHEDAGWVAVELQR